MNAINGGEWIPPELFARRIGNNGRRLWAILWRRRGQCVHHEVIRATLYADRDDRDRREIVLVYVYYLRRALAPTPWRIENVERIGYRLVGPAAPAALEGLAAPPGPLPEIARSATLHGRLLRILWQHRNQYVSRDALMDGLYGGRADPPLDTIIAGRISRLRRALQGTNWRIERVYHAGYRLISVAA